LALAKDGAIAKFNMFLTVHAAIGALIGQQINQPLLGFVFAFFSHWLIDAIPHGDEKLFASWLPSNIRKKRLLIISSIDIFGAILFVLFVISSNILTTAMLVGIIGAGLPDALWGASELFTIKNQLWQKLNEWHNQFHSFFPKQISLMVGGLFQLIIFFLTVFALIR
jgi:hypothetical protein